MNNEGHAPGPDGAERGPTAGRVRGAAGSRLLEVGWRYGIAVLGVAVATALRWVLQDLLGAGLEFITFYPVVPLVAMVAGGGPGLLATALSATVADNWLLRTGDASEPLAVGLFAASGLLVSSMAEMLRRARRHEAAFLEVLVGQRTRELRHEIEDRRRAEHALRESEQRLRAILDTAVDAIITINGEGVIQSVNPAAERMFGYASAEMTGRNVSLLMPPPYREQHDGYLARYRQTGAARVIGVGREAEGRRKDGTVFPVELAVSEVEPLELFTGIIHDLTRRKELEREVVELVSLEQRRIGQDLHDSVGQELTALNLMVDDLAEALRTDRATGAELVGRMAQGLQRSRRDLRAVLLGLLPVAVDAEGLMAALADLAGRARGDGKVACTFSCPEPVLLADNLTATHLFLIAKEAVHNALKHARPRNIRISLASNHLLVLQVRDDGIGLPAQAEGSRCGLGLRIMRNRAAIIGAKLTVEPAQPGGTLVTCSLTRANHAEG